MTRFRRVAPVPSLLLDSSAVGIIVSASVSHGKSASGAAHHGGAC